LREGVRLLLEGDALWKAQAHAIGEHLIAAGHRPTDNQAENHELAEIARQLRSFAGTITSPLPHGRAIQHRGRE
jgi:hypothetical protein